MTPPVDFRIWDIHCHLPSRRVQGNTLREQTANMLETAERVGIDKICLFLRTGRDQEPTNEDIRQLLDAYEGRVFGFVWVDLERTDEAIDKINRWIADGPMVGIKLGGGSGIYSKPEYDRVFQRGVDLDAVFYMHTWIKLGGDPLRPGGGNLPKESMPEDVVAVAERYPDYPFICGHTGGDWERGIRTCAPQENVSIEIGGGFPTYGQIDMGVREMGAERVIYGSDVTGRSFSSQLGKVLGADITARQRQLIFADNLQRMMTPMLEKKKIALEW